MYGEHKALTKKKVQRWNISIKKRAQIQTIHVCPILGPLST